ncbi:hypothetical protein PR048_021084 [Dryococelus australis]|uniref:Uncharacterized protein n=1 Tax=Dryococelus australis TaxID=614101 RepID=A0ABQ9GX85_9NEOP|nr:hypothetical protein PR048_021084 [Dryococelus australis]
MGYFDDCGVIQHGRCAVTSQSTSKLHTIDIVKKYAALHYQYSDHIIELAQNVTKYGTPMNPPIWWIDPENTEAQAVNDGKCNLHVSI